MTKYETIMQILENEFDMEMGCAKTSLELMRKTWNPIRKCQLWFSHKTFLNHAVGIDIAISSIKRKVES